jgi:hypothetical protein
MLITLEPRDGAVPVSSQLLLRAKPAGSTDPVFRAQ